MKLDGKPKVIDIVYDSEPSSIVTRAMKSEDMFFPLEENGE